jgi:hypothetical protein
MDVLLEPPLDDLVTRCNATLPDGLEILACARVEGSVPKLSADIRVARYEVAIDSSALGPGRNPTWDSFLKRVGDSGQSKNGAAREALRALEEEIRKRFQPSAVNEERDARQPSLIDIQIFEQGGELRIAYLSTMKQGKSLFPEMLERYVGDSLGLETPMHVVRKAL